MLKKIIAILIIINSFIGLSFGDEAQIGASDCDGRFCTDLGTSIDNIRDRLDAGPAERGADGLQAFIVNLASNIFMPIMIMIGLVIAIIGFYKVMFTESDEDKTRGANYIIWGTVGIIVMTSATYITHSLVGETGSGLETEGISLAESIYSNIVFPFFQIFAYLVVGILFIVLLINAFKLLTTNQEEVGKSAKTIVVRNIIGILMIISSSEIVRIIYGTHTEQRNTGNLGDIGTGILADRNIEFITNIINWGLSFVAFIILIIIIYQSYLLLVKPEDEETVKKLRKNFVYVFIGSAIIGGGFLLTNFLIIN
ncbi:hypothetical protein [Candidatus Absconditicoccus praedator]|uniref:hypothetical protein n=1 Tax=Candidatus Absconditicoccus praedator TaxID=2735562 RepID=UPI001E3C694C|nr:hypothetical protein [Candidatus Absconditicoccus praedator]UFX83082.1 hypothetical protein HLG78_03025 [Candidatus Absconditicoccus praedator]